MPESPSEKEGLSLDAFISRLRNEETLCVATERGFIPQCSISERTVGKSGYCGLCKVGGEKGC